MEILRVGGESMLLEFSVTNYRGVEVKRFPILFDENVENDIPYLVDDCNSGKTNFIHALSDILFLVHPRTTERNENYGTCKASTF